MLIQKAQREHYDVLDMNRDARYRIDASKVAFGLLHTNYEARIRNIIRNGFHVRSAADLKRSYAKGAYFVLWYDWTYSPRRSRSMKSFATIFGIWHELMRSSHNGLHECMVYGKRVLIINVYSPSKPYLLYVGRKNFFQDSLISRLMLLSSPKMCPFLCLTSSQRTSSMRSLIITSGMRFREC